ncbi:MAG: c-type cytochrome [Porticoccaceae bacterium]|nr:c-type cytochrome [Porticoccaceae bacterium]
MITPNRLLLVLTLILSTQILANGDADAGADKIMACAGCHGMDGNSMIAAFPKLAGLGEKYLYQQLRHVQKGERIIMEMTGILDASTQQDLWDMAAYYNAKERQLSGAEDITLIGISDPDDALLLGEKIYRGGNLGSGVPSCTGCHSPAGTGNGPAGYPGLGGQHAGYIEKQLLAYRRGERNSGNNAKIMQGVAEYLSDKEIKAVANYIAGLN